MRKIIGALVLAAALLVPAAAFAQAQVVMAPTAQDPQEEYLPTNQISAAFGVPICAFASVSGFTGSGCVSGDFLWFNVPIVYRYRLNDYMAVGGGLQLTGVAGGGSGVVFFDLVGSFRFYALPDWIYIDADVLLGWPYVSFVPALGLAIPIGNVSIFLENQVWLSYFYAIGSDSFFFGFWQPELGVEFRF